MHNLKFVPFDYKRPVHEPRIAPPPLDPVL